MRLGSSLDWLPFPPDRRVASSGHPLGPSLLTYEPRVKLAEPICRDMQETSVVEERATVVPLPENITSVQPGGGFCYRMELAWGRWRRWYLKTFRGGYVRRMAELRTGDAEGSPHEILDSRDLKFVRNLCTADWPAEVDPFRSREKIPLARWGLAETLMMATPLLILTLLPALLAPAFWWIGLAPAVVLGWVFYFFRDPPRKVPTDKGLLIAPADGKIVDITRIDHHDFVGGPAVRIGVFLSIFNVHINRAASNCRVIELRYHPGPFLNALNPESAIKNENMWIALEETEAPYRRMVVRQIAGAIARRIVCSLRPGEELTVGQKFGMIKLGSRTEMLIPDSEGLTIVCQEGQKIRAGIDILVKYADETGVGQEQENSSSGTGGTV